MFSITCTRFSVLVWLLSAGLLLVAYSAFALVGAIDTEDRYPFVVQISSEIGSCSGAVSRAGLVSTAAHCVWNSDVGFAKQLKIRFRDADGVNRTVDARRIFIPDGFSAAFSKWKAEQGVVSSQENIRNFLNMTFRDIAFIVPQRWVETEGIPHWATELVRRGQEALFEDTIEKELGDTIEKELGDLANVRAMTVGYGNFECNDFNKREKNCRSDGYRRYAEIPLRAEVTVANRTWRVPSIWCTGVNVEKINPVQHGDSGGPLFVKALDGRWLFVGYNSGGNSQGSCASSILVNKVTWSNAASFLDNHWDEIGINQGAKNWLSHQTRRVLDEVLESWSSTTEQALRRLSSFYSEIFHHCGKDAGFAALSARKRTFAERWPERKFRLKPGTLQYIEHGVGDPQQYAALRATVLWAVKNSRTGAQASGESDIYMTIKFGFESERVLVANDGSVPKIQYEAIEGARGDMAALECMPPTPVRVRDEKTYQQQLERCIWEPKAECPD